MKQPLADQVKKLGGISLPECGESAELTATWNG